MIKETFLCPHCAEYKITLESYSNEELSREYKEWCKKNNLTANTKIMIDGGFVYKNVIEWISNNFLIMDK